MAAINPDDLDTQNLNAQVHEDQIKGIYDEIQKMYKDSYSNRLGMPAPARVTLFTIGGAFIGGLGGMLGGWTDASMKYLAANSHRLPTSYNGWFFYHKRKTYYCTKDAMGKAFRTGVKVGGFIGVMFSIEAALDWARGQTDFANTMLAVCLPGFGYAWYNQMSRVQAREVIHKGGKIGLTLGLAQDALQYIRGVDVWYLNEWFGIKPVKLSQRLRNYVEAQEKK
jgi:hypothetical protein